jgi:hypothetical protein
MSQMGPLRATLEKFAPEGYGKQSPSQGASTRSTLLVAPRRLLIILNIGHGRAAAPNWSAHLDDGTSCQRLMFLR